tara:strand:- start:238 stop:432 length:195 start_codon:yes stop_codon:yes gene_type:complete
MGLRNAFADVATEVTLEQILIDQITKQESLLGEILTQLKIMNLHLSQINDEEFVTDDLDQETDI